MPARSQARDIDPAGLRRIGRRLRGRLPGTIPWAVAAWLLALAALLPLAGAAPQRPSGPGSGPRQGRTRLSPVIRPGSKLSLAGVFQDEAPSPQGDAPRPTPPAAAVSWYMRSTRPSRAWAMGCRHGRSAAADPARRDALVVLDFGRPARRHRTWGASLFGAGFRGTVAIRQAVQAYARAFWRCSSAAPGAHLTLAAGTSNWGRQVYYGHGRAWAGMVNAADDWLLARGTASKVEVVGADDIEPEWNGPRASIRWVQGYDSVARWPYFDYGSADGCPPYGTCAGAWTMEHLWYVAWGAPSAWPLPEIYAADGSNAAQWSALSAYAYRRHGVPMAFVGVMSQWNTCHRIHNRWCWGLHNTPRQAWSQLDRALSRELHTAPRIRWTTDISP